jgi:hypothetical protein
MTAQSDSGPAAAKRAGGIDFNRVAFVAVAFLVVGLMGVFATYAAPLPLERAMAREAALDAVLDAARTPNPEAAMAALKARLDDSAGVLAGGTAGIAARVAAERLAMRERFAAEAAATGLRLRWLIVMVTLMGAVFAITMMGSGARRA